MITGRGRGRGNLAGAARIMPARPGYPLEIETVYPGRRLPLVVTDAVEEPLMSDDVPTPAGIDIVATVTAPWRLETADE